MSMSGIGGGRAVIPRDLKALNFEVTRLVRLRTAILIDDSIASDQKKKALGEIDALVSTLSEIVKSKV